MIKSKNNEMNGSDILFLLVCLIITGCVTVKAFTQIKQIVKSVVSIFIVILSIGKIKHSLKAA